VPGRRLRAPFRLARLVAALAALAPLACPGGDRPAGSLAGRRVAAEELARRDLAQRLTVAGLARVAHSVRELPHKQVLFGDLHVHTTYSLDAFAMELPIMELQGIHTPADACDFARHCAGLDFFALTDHAESLIPEHWAATKQAVRECNALAGDAGDPDLIAFTGFEWTQVDTAPNRHWGHKNVIFHGSAEAELPARPIGSRADEGIGVFANVSQATRARFLDPLHWKEYADLAWLVERVRSQPLCAQGVDTRELPPGCAENAPTPEELYRKLDEWGFPALVIPHGNAWGLYTPTTASWEKALTPAQHDPERQRLLEIMSGHGSSEEYRAWRPARVAEGDALACPEPTAEFLPCCWQAGELMRSRCGALPAAECEAQVAEARRLALAAGPQYRLVFPEAAPEEWLDCDQCRDCFKPAFAQRPTETAQYAMALSNFAARGADGRPLRFRFGFIASTDDHTARPGTGYKQYERRKMTMSTGPARGPMGSPFGEARDPDRPQPAEFSYPVPDGERVASFTYPGGILAVHAEARSRDAVWQALRHREVYGTSGPRMLLWFDLANAPDGPAPMGSEVALSEAPRFEVRAAGAFRQRPGCAAPAAASLPAERLAYLCAGECENPGDERHPITAIEVVRIRPQRTPGEPVAGLIEDPWRSFACKPSAAGCTVAFEDPDFAASGRDAVYYVRALQEPTPAINGANLRTRFDASGNAVSVAPCYGDWRTPLDDECLAPVRERAWSSPIFVNFAAGAR
jgi:hypothetical protein